MLSFFAVAWSHKQPSICWHVISLGAHDLFEDQMVQNFIMNRRIFQPARIPICPPPQGNGHLALSVLPMELMEKLLLGT